jgi:hypothetical protein
MNFIGINLNQFIPFAFSILPVVCTLLIELFLKRQNNRIYSKNLWYNILQNNNIINKCTEQYDYLEYKTSTPIQYLTFSALSVTLLLINSFLIRNIIKYLGHNEFIESFNYSYSAFFMYILIIFIEFLIICIFNKELFFGNLFDDIKLFKNIFFFEKNGDLKPDDKIIKTYINNKIRIKFSYILIISLILHISFLLINDFILIISTNPLSVVFIILVSIFLINSILLFRKANRVHNEFIKIYLSKKYFDLFPTITVTTENQKISGKIENFFKSKTISIISKDAKIYFEWTSIKSLQFENSDIDDEYVSNY